MKIIRIIAAIACLCFLAQRASAQTATINWNSTAQTVDGFGVYAASDSVNLSGTLPGTSTNYADFFFSPTAGLGLSLIRTAIPNNGTYPGNCATVNSGCAGTSVSNMNLAIARGAKAWSSPWSPPASMKTNGNTVCGAGGGSGALSGGSYSAYATWLSNYVASVASQGISLYALSVQNEPDQCPSAYDGALWSNSNFDTFIKTNLGPTFAANGQTSTLIMMPESSQWASFGGLANTCMTDSSCSRYVGINAWHDYDDASSISNTYSAPHFWETEASAGVGYGPSLCGGCFDPSMADGLLWAGIIDNRMSLAGANEWGWWAAVTSCCTDNEGLTNTTSANPSNLVPKHTYVLGNYSKFIRPGWVRISATHVPASGVTVSAYKDPGGSGNFAIVATNQNGSSQAVTFSLSGFLTSTVTPWLTDTSNNLAQQTPISVSGTSFSVTLGASSVTTFVGTTTLSSGVLDPSRSIDWSKAGAAAVLPGGVLPARTTVCATPSLAGGSGNSASNGAAIRSAIASCASGEVVLLASSIGQPANTWYVDYIAFGTYPSVVNNVTLRGAGPMSTSLTFTGGAGCNGLGADICMMNGDNNYSGGPENVISWIGGYSKGATSITLGSVQQGSLGNLHVGSLIYLDQTDDATDPGNVFMCQTVNFNGACSQQGGVGNGFPVGSAGQEQVVKVTSISGSTIGITPGLYMANWRSSQNPLVWFSGQLPITGDGVEDMTVDVTNASTYSNGSAFMTTNAYADWFADIRTINSGGAATPVHKHYWLYQSAHITVRDSYMYGSDGSSESYGVDSGVTTSDNLVENSICQHISTCEITEGASGTVFAYNTAIDNFYNGGGNAPNYQQEDQYHHSVGDCDQLYESNFGIGGNMDDVHGTSCLNTFLRVFVNGRDPALTSDNGTGDCASAPPPGTSPCAKNQYTSAIQLLAYSREMNIIGSVLGTSTWHTIYSNNEMSPSDPGNGMCNVSIYCLGFSGNGGSRFYGCSGSGCTPFTIDNDANVAATLYRWGNYDPVHAAVQWNSAEVPSGLPSYAQPVPSTHAIPNSLYLPSNGVSAPPFWISSIPWPAIGPDVTGGNVPNVGGFVYQTPSAKCALGPMGINPNGSSGVRPFDAYLTTGGGCGYGTTGSGPVVSLSASTLALGPVAPNATTTQTVTLTNTGGANLVMTSTVISGSGLYTTSSNTCTGTIAPMGTCTTTVLFSPTTFGRTNATLTYSNNATPATQTVILNGNAVVSPPGPPPSAPTLAAYPVTYHHKTFFAGRMR